MVNSYLLDLMMNITFAMLGVYVSKVYFSFMLLDFIGRSDTLKNVIRAVTTNITQFLMTGLLGVIILYIFASLTFFSNMKNTTLFIEDSSLAMCSNYMHCFLTMLGFGMRSGGGIGDVIAYPDYQTEFSDYVARFFNDFLFFVLVSIIYLNILFGIIIDTFAELRDKKNLNGKPKLLHLANFNLLRP